MSVLATVAREMKSRSRVERATETERRVVDFVVGELCEYGAVHAAELMGSNSMRCLYVSIDEKRKVIERRNDLFSVDRLGVVRLVDAGSRLPFLNEKELQRFAELLRERAVAESANLEFRLFLRPLLAVEILGCAVGEKLSVEWAVRELRDLIKIGVVPWLSWIDDPLRGFVVCFAECSKGFCRFK